MKGGNANEKESPVEKERLLSTLSYYMELCETQQKIIKEQGEILALLLNDQEYSMAGNEEH